MLTVIGPTSTARPLKAERPHSSVGDLTVPEFSQQHRSPLQLSFQSLSRVTSHQSAVRNLEGRALDCGVSQRTAQRDELIAGACRLQL